MSIILREFCSNITQSFRRFPVPILLLLIFCVISIIVNHDIIHSKTSVLKYIFWSICIFINTTLFLERFRYQLPIYLASVLVSVITIAYLDHIQDTAFISFIFLNIALIFSIFILPFINLTISDLNIWKFNYTILIRFCFSVFTVTILSAGIVGLMYSIEYLFNISFPSTLYRDVFIISVTLISPIFTISSIPIINKLSDINIEAKWLKVILLYTVIPVSFAYAIVIHAYIIKALYTQTLPSNISGYLSSIFCIKMILIFVLSTPWDKEANLISFFRKYCGFLLLAPIILFIISLIIRINIYGITPIRYISIMLAFWLVLSMFFMLNHYKFNAIKYISVTSLLIILVCSFGPWSIDNVSYRRYFHQLQDILLQHNMLIDGHFIYNKHHFSKVEILKIKESISYITRFNRTSDISLWFSHIPNANIHKHNNYHNILKDFGIEHEENHDHK